MTDEQFAQIVTLLTGIRDALTATPEPMCEHPEDRRVKLSAMGHEDWTCRDCGLHVRDGEVVD